MKKPRPGQSRLKVRLALMRFEWGNAVVLMLFAAAAAAWLWSMPHLHVSIASQHERLAHVWKSLQSADIPAPVEQRPLAETRLAAFYDALGEKRYAEQQVKILFAIASKANLTLSQAEYKFAFDKNGRYYTYRILLPVKGSYSAVRQFCEQTLLSIPFASLDEISFRRDAIASRTLEAKLGFTLYLADMPMSLQQSVALNPKDDGQ